MEGLRAMHTMATMYHCRPSSLVNVTDPHDAYLVDLCVLWVGLHPPVKDEQQKLRY